MEYKIISGTTAAQLQERISLLLNEGWIPLGGSTVESSIFYQTIYRESKTVKESQNTRDTLLKS